MKVEIRGGLDSSDPLWAEVKTLAGNRAETLGEPGPFRPHTGRPSVADFKEGFPSRSGRITAVRTGPGPGPTLPILRVLQFATLLAVIAVAVWGWYWLGNKFWMGLLG